MKLYIDLILSKLIGGKTWRLQEMFVRDEEMYESLPNELAN